MMIKFEAKAVLSNEKLDELEIEHKDGWVTGSLVDGQWILGEIVDVSEEYIQPSFWVKVDPSTVVQTDLLETLKSQNS